MSVATATRTIQFVSKSGTYTAVLTSPSGDLYQEWTGSQANPTSIYPDFSVTQPVLRFVCLSSRANETVVTPTGVKFWFGDTLIDFGTGDTSIGVLAGYFKLVAPTGDEPHWGLKIIKNLAQIANYAPVTIKAVADIAYGIQSDSITASHTISMLQSTGESYKVTIGSGDTNNFVITDKDPNNSHSKCVLEAHCYKGSTAVTQNLTYKWFKMDPLSATGWTELTGETGKTLTVAESDIDTYGEFRVEVRISGNEAGSDIQGVMDASDPYDIDPCPSPLDETITEDPSGNGQVTYTPKIVKRGTNTQVLPSTLFHFIVKDAAGVILNKWQNGNADETNPEMSTTAQTSYTVTRAQCLQAGGDLSIAIIAAS